MICTPRSPLAPSAGTQRRGRRVGRPSARAGLTLVEIRIALSGDSPPGQLRDDPTDDHLQLPRDLDRDLVIDDLDPTDDYVLLPIVARVLWQGRQGPCEKCTYAPLTRYRTDES